MLIVACLSVARRVCGSGVSTNCVTVDVLLRSASFAASHLFVDPSICVDLIESCSTMVLVLSASEAPE